MPDERFNDAEMDRFHDAVDRLASGAPAPFVNDPDLQELLELAGRLQHDLAGGLPDPAFRASLRNQLLTPPAPGVVSLPQRAARRQQTARFPYVAAFGSIAAVMVAVLLVGAFAMMNGDSDDTPPGIANAPVAETETAIAASFAISSATEDSTAEDTPSSAQTESARTEPTATSAEATPSTAVTAVTPTTSAPPSPSTPTVVATLIATVQPTAEPTSDRGLAMVLPPVDSTTVESGPVPAADPGAGGAITTMTYVLATEMPVLQPLAPAYLLAPPTEDPVQLVQQVAGSLGIDGEVSVSSEFGKTDYHISTADGRTFHWYPETGAFSFSSPGDDPGMVMTSDEVVENCKGWLSRLGYPVQALTETMHSQPVENTGWLVETAMNAMPQPGFGHPLGVRMIANSEGEVIDATGYWLAPMHQADVKLITAEEAWDALTAHQGYWFGAGGAYVEGGELRVESIEVSYVLTNAEEGMILQPVIAMRGEFLHADGISTSGVTVFIKAGSAMAWYSGP